MSLVRVQTSKTGKGEYEKELKKVVKAVAFEKKSVFLRYVTERIVRGTRQIKLKIGIQFH